MKKLLYILAALALVCTACHKDEPNVHFVPEPYRIILLLTDDGEVYDVNDSMLCQLDCKTAINIFAVREDYMVFAMPPTHYMPDLGYWLNGPHWHILKEGLAFDSLMQATMKYNDYYVLYRDTVGDIYYDINGNEATLLDDVEPNTQFADIGVGTKNCYIVGMEQTGLPVLWKNGNKMYLPYENNTGAVVTSVDGVASDWMAGGALRQGTNTVPVMWLNNKVCPLPLQEYSGGMVNDVLLAVDSKYYAVGYRVDDMKHRVATMWAGDVTVKYEADPSCVNSEAINMLKYGDDIYVLTLEDGKYHLWMNGECLYTLKNPIGLFRFVVYG